MKYGIQKRYTLQLLGEVPKERIVREVCNELIAGVPYSDILKLFNVKITNPNHLTHSNEYDSLSREDKYRIDFLKERGEFLIDAKVRVDEFR